MTRTLLAALVAFFSLTANAGVAGPQAPLVEVFKSPYCGCCKDWVEHLRKEGFAVRAVDVTDVPATRQKLGMPDRYGSCHTARVAGYTLEGHVPAREIKRLLKEKPKAVGLAVPGMPNGSPGMDGPRHDPYDVLLVTSDGQAQRFASYR